MQSDLTLTKPKRRTLAASIAVAVLVAAGASCKKKDDAKAMEMPPPAVTTMPALARDVPIYLDEIGKIDASESVAIRALVAGKITDIHFTDGADVKKGDPLFTVDPRPYQAELKQREAELNESRAVYDLAKTEFDRYDLMFKSRAASQQDYDTHKNAMAVAEARIQSNLAAIEVAKVSVDYSFIKSPIDGRTGERMVDAGNIVGPNMTSDNGAGVLLTIQRLEPIYADFTIAESQLPRVRQHMADGTLVVRVWLPGDNGEGATGDLTFLDNAVQSGTGTVKLRATLPNKDRHFWPGQFVRVRLILSIIKDAVLIPTEATQIGQRGPFVYVVNKQSAAEMREVKLGQRQGDEVVVQEGVKVGEDVVLTGQMMLQPGGKVSATAHGAAPAAPAATQPAADKASSTPGEEKGKS